MKRIYLDSNATTRVADEVLEAMLPWLREELGNPSSGHAAGALARDAIEAARADLVGLLGGCVEEWVFTSGGTESIATALSSALSSGRGVAVASAVEHPAVLRTLESWSRRGGELVVAQVDASGALELEPLLAHVDERVGLVCVQLANNETGVVTPVEVLQDIGAACRERGVRVHVDAVQAAGKLALDVNALGADYVSFSAHKVHGPKGCGALWVRPGAPLVSLFEGGPQEGGRRAGTQNVAGIVGFGRAGRLALEFLGQGEHEQHAARRDRLEAQLCERVGPAHVHGAEGPRLWNTSCLGFADDAGGPGLDAEVLLSLLDGSGVCASAGAACSSGSRRASHVLVAMGRADLAHASLRLSLNRWTTEEELERALEHLVEAIETARSLGPPQALESTESPGSAVAAR